MKRYRVTKPYSSHYGTFEVGHVLDLDDDTAAWLARDSMGGIELIVPPVPEPTPEPEPRAVEAPPHDRMVRGRKKRAV